MGVVIDRGEIDDRHWFSITDPLSQCCDGGKRHRRAAAAEVSRTRAPVGLGWDDARSQWERQRGPDRGPKRGTPSQAGIEV